MEWAALITWVLTAGGGFVMLGLWLKYGGRRQSSDAGARIRSGRILSHFAMAATGLVVWIVYLAADSDALRLDRVRVAAIVALLGFSMIATWLAQRRQPAASAPSRETTTTSAEQRFPVPVVAPHGLLAATTMVLVLLTAAGVGGS